MKYKYTSYDLFLDDYSTVCLIVNDDRKEDSLVFQFQLYTNIDAAFFLGRRSLKDDTLIVIQEPL